MVRRRESSLSHGGIFYRKHRARELERKNVLHYRQASSVVAFVRHNPEYAGRWHPRESFVETASGGQMKVYRLSASDRRDFTRFLREHGWAVPTHSTRKVSFKLAKRRTNFSVEALGADPELVGKRNPWGGSP